MNSPNKPFNSSRRSANALHRAESELNRLRTEYENTMKALIQRLEELNNGQPGQPDADR